MSAPDPHGGPRPGEATGLRAVDWREVGMRVLTWTVIAVVAVLVALGLAAFVPRWWAQRVATLVDGTFSLGAWWGVAIGFVFTALPLAAAWQAVRPHLSGRARALLATVAVLLALPNLLTLSVVLGANNAALAGRRIMDVDAPAFRGATAWGAGAGAVVVVVVLLLWASYRRRGRELREIKHHDVTRRQD